MELSVLCGAEVAVVVFGEDGRMSQFSSNDDMGELLKRFSAACRRPHEVYCPQDVRARPRGGQGVGGWGQEGPALR